MIDPFSEGVFTSSLPDPLLDTDPAITGANDLVFLGEHGELTYCVFSFFKSGSGDAPDLAYQLQVSNNFIDYENVPGASFIFGPGGGDGGLAGEIIGGTYGARVAMARIQSVRVGGLAGLGPNRRQSMRWRVTSSGGSATFKLSRSACAWSFHKGSIPENNAIFDGNPGKPGRLKLDFA